MSETITIKGTSEGLVITLGRGSLDLVLDEMEKLLASRASFFLGGRVALRVGNRALSVEQLQNIGSTIERHGVTLWAVESEHPGTQVAVKELGLETGLHRLGSGTPQGPAFPGDGARAGCAGRSSMVPPPPRKRYSADEAPENVPLEELAGIVVRGTLRSGQMIHHGGHITLIGDVNPGAEVVAGGDVIIWGKLRGTVHAGVIGDDRAVVCALQLAPSQIRIGSHIARPPERSRLPKIPEIACVQDGRIIVEHWNVRKQVAEACWVPGDD